MSQPFIQHQFKVMRDINNTEKIYIEAREANYYGIVCKVWLYCLKVGSNISWLLELIVIQTCMLNNYDK